MGRPSEYDPQIALEICERLAMGQSLRTICESDDRFPAVSTVCLWNIDNRCGFSEQYARSRRSQAELLADEIFTIADDGSNDTYTDEDGNTRTNQDVINRSRLRVDTRKWYLSKVLPKIYGDKLTHSGDPEAPIGITLLTSIPRPKRIE